MAQFAPEVVQAAKHNIRVVDGPSRKKALRALNDLHSKDSPIDTSEEGVKL